MECWKKLFGIVENWNDGMMGENLFIIKTHYSNIPQFQCSVI